MTTGLELKGTLDQVTAPGADGFSVLAVPSATQYFVGKGVDGAIALLTPADTTPEPPTRLKRLFLDPRLRCRVESGAGGPVEGDYGVIQFNIDDETLIQPFLDVAATMIRLLGPTPARGSILGLWAELLVIDRSTDPLTMIDAWHAYVDARFDFAAAGSRLEVKGTTRDVRAHMFSLPQLQPVVGSKVIVASIMTTETSLGTSVGAMVGRLEGKLGGDASRQMKVHEQVADILGGDWIRHTDRRFDETQAVDSLLLLDASNIPRVQDPPPAVIKVDLTVDCTDVPPEPTPTGLAALIR